jgi:hypothetical protein
MQKLDKAFVNRTGFLAMCSKLTVKLIVRTMQALNACRFHKKMSLFMAFG